MNDLISRQAAIDTMCELMHHWFGGDPKDEIREIKRELGKLPSAQPEVIRCEDCMHNGSFDTDCPIDWNGKEYCSFAERKDDEQMH